MSVKVALAVTLVMLLAVPFAADAAPPLTGLFTATVNPVSACAGEEQTYALTITCTQIANQGMGSARIDIPSAFTLAGSFTISYPTGKPWTVAIDGTQLVLASNANDNRLACDSAESVTVAFAATANDPGLYTWTTYGYQSTVGDPDDKYYISGAQPTVDILDCGEKCYESETGWAEGEPYNPSGQGNWAMYHVYDGAETVRLLAGQTMEAGSVSFSEPDAGYVSITIDLNGGWEFAPVEENVKIQPYGDPPSGNPAPGQFEYKDDASGTSFTVDVPAMDYYGVHVDLYHEVECP